MTERRHFKKYDVSKLNLAEEKRFYVPEDMYQSVKNCVYQYGLRTERKFNSHKGKKGSKFFVEFVRVK